MTVPNIRRWRAAMRSSDRYMDRRLAELHIAYDRDRWRVRSYSDCEDRDVVREYRLRVSTGNWDLEIYDQIDLRKAQAHEFGLPLLIELDTWTWSWVQARNITERPAGSTIILDDDGGGD